MERYGTRVQRKKREFGVCATPTLATGSTRLDARSSSRSHTPARDTIRRRDSMPSRRICGSCARRSCGPRELSRTATKIARTTHRLNGERMAVITMIVVAGRFAAVDATAVLCVLQHAAAHGLRHSLIRRPHRGVERLRASVAQTRTPMPECQLATFRADPTRAAGNHARRRSSPSQARGGP